MSLSPDSTQFDALRTEFIGRVQEQRQFLMVLGGLLAHQHAWYQLARQHGSNFDPAQAPGDNSYANIFLPHGIGGIGKSWLTRRCLDLAEGIPNEPPILTLYDDLSLGAPVLEPGHLLERLSSRLSQAGYESYLADYNQAKADLPGIVERVARYQFEYRDHWDRMLQTATELIARGRPEAGYHSFAQISLAYTHASGAETAGKDAPTLAKAYDLLLEQMQQEGKITAAEAALFRNPPAMQAAELARALMRIASRRPLVIGLDNLEIIVPLEPLIRDCLVLPTNHAPIIWILSGRNNLADERVADINGEQRVHKGYRDLLGENPPVVWDMSMFGDADLRDYLQAEAERRRAPLIIDDVILEAVKATSSGVPLVVEMVADALFTMDRDEFLREFALDDKSLLPGDRLDQITARFLRYCLTQPEDLERVQAMALLRKDAEESALAAAWGLSPEQSVRNVIYGLRTRYAFVLPQGLHDAVYEFVRRQLRSSTQYNLARARLSRRAVYHYRELWNDLHRREDDPALRARNPHWQRATRDLLNALLWYSPDEAVSFLLPRFIEGLGFDRAFSNGLLMQAEEFLSGSISTFSHAYADLLRRMRLGLRDIEWASDEPGEAVGAMVDNLLQAPGLAPLHLSILHLWQGNWLAENGEYEPALTAYLEADRHRPADAEGLGRQLGKAFYELSSRFLWPVSATETAASPLGLQAAERAVALDADNGAAWFNLGAALDYLGREAESVAAYEQAIELEPQPAYYNNLGDVYSELGRDEEAIAAYRQAIELDPAYPWPYHSLGQLHAERGNYESALDYYQQAIDHHQRDRDKAISWDSFGDAHAALGNYDEAISAYRWAGVLNPRYAPPWFSLGNIYGRLGRIQEAIDAFQTAVSLDPSFAWSYHNLGLMHARAGNYTAALYPYRQAIDRHTDDEARAVSWVALGDAYAELERYGEAVTAYRQALQLDPQQAEAWHNLGDVYRQQGDSPAAIDAYRQAVRLNPDYAPAWNSLGAVYGQFQRHSEAIDAYQRVIKLNPDYAWPYNNIGFIYARQGNHRQAETFYKQAIERHLDDEGKAVSWSNLGDVYVALDNQAEAIKAYRQATRLAPNYAWPHHNLALLYEAQGDDQAAIKSYHRAIERHSEAGDRALSWHKLADIYRRREMYGEALDAYQQTLALDPANAPAWNSLGDVHLAQARYQEATQAFHRAIEIDPNFGWPYHNLGLISSDYGAHETALPLYRQAIERHRDDRSRAISWDKLGDTHLALGDAAEAGDAYRQAIQLAPDYAPPYHSLADIHAGRSDYQTALAFYQQAIERHEQDKRKAAAWNGLGNVYQALGRTAEAVKAYQAATQLDPGLAAPWNSLGNIYRGQHKYDEAAPAYQQAIKLDAANPQPYHNLGLVYEAQGEHEAAIERFEQAIERYGDGETGAKADSWYHRGNAYAGLERYETALDAYRQAIQLDDNFAAPQVKRGDTLSKLGRYPEAIDAYRRALQIDPANAGPWNSLGDVYRLQERDEEAGAAYRRAIEIDPAFAWPYHNLGAIDEAHGRLETAINFYRQAIERQSQAAGRALSWTGLGNIYRLQGRDEQAIEAYQQAIKADAGPAQPYHSLGLIYNKLGQFETAIELHRQAIERYETEADQAVAYKDLGDTYINAHRWNEAIEALQHALDLDATYARPWHCLGDVYRQTERADDAIHAYQQAIEKEPTYGWSYNNLGLVYEQLGRYDRAESLYRQAIERQTSEADKAVAWNNLGDVYHARRQYDQAVESYRQAIALHPTYAHPWNGLGNAYRAQGIDKDVAEAYRRAIDLDASFAWPYHNLGSLSLQRGAYPQAITYYQQALERHRRPQDQAVSWNGLGNVYRSLGHFKEAIEAYRRAIHLNPAEGWPYHNLGFVYKNLQQYYEAIVSYERAIERFELDEQKAVSWNNLGNVHTALERHQDAIKAYRQAIHLNDAYALPWHNLGEVYTRLEETDEAIRAYRQAIQRDPAYFSAWNNLGDIYRTQGRFDEAVDAYRQAIRLDARNPWPHHNLGVMHEERGDYELAISHYQQAIERHQNNEYKAILWDNIGGMQRLMGDEERAIEAYRRSAGLDPTYASPWYSLGNIYAALDRDEEAIQAYRQTINLNQRDPWPHHNLALVYEKLERYSEAITFYRQAIERHASDQNRAVSWESLGNVYSDAGRYEEAVQALQEAIKLNPDYALPWNSLGDVYQALGQPQKAIEAYQRAISLDPNYAWPYNSLGLVYAQIGRHEQAISIYKQVISLPISDHDRAVSWNSLGDVYIELQREQDAIQAYERAIKLDPDYAWPYNGLGSIYERRGEHEQAYALYQQATRRHRQRTLV